MKTSCISAFTILSLFAAAPLAAQGCSDEATADADADAGSPSTTTTSAPTPTPSTTPSTTPSSAPDAAREASATSCTAALETLMKPIDKVTTGAVTILDEGDASSGRTVYVDATAGGAAQAGVNPRTYVDLATSTRVDLTDKTASASTEWDLALERAVLFTNGGHGGPGAGSAIYVAKTFADVTAADAAGKTFPAERFVDEACNPVVDQTNAVKTTFDGWYDYDLATSKVTPKAGTFLVRGAKGALYKVAILSYYATPDGGVGLAGANYVLRVGKL